MQKRTEQAVTVTRNWNVFISTGHIRLTQPTGACVKAKAMKSVIVFSGDMLKIANKLSKEIRNEK